MHLSREGSVLREILQRRTRLIVEWARDGAPLRAGHVYIAPPDHHLLVDGEFRCKLSRGKRVCYARPAADVLFTSAAAALGRRVVAVVLSGAGHDGADGALAIRHAGGTVLAQSPEGSAVPGMPRAVIECGGMDLVVPLDGVARALISLVMVRGTAQVLGLQKTAVDLPEKRPLLAFRRVRR
jgi:two-component system chemotaxis response regulator CheB